MTEDEWAFMVGILFLEPSLSKWFVDFRDIMLYWVHAHHLPCVRRQTASKEYSAKAGTEFEEWNLKHACAWEWLDSYARMVLETSAK